MFAWLRAHNLKLILFIELFVDGPKIGNRFLQTFTSPTKIEPSAVLLQNVLRQNNNNAGTSMGNCKLIEYQFAALNINNVIPPSIRPPTSNQRIEEPGKDERKNINTPDSVIINDIMEKVNEIKGNMDLPPLEGQNESIEAAVLIEIRRLKMKKHQRKKWLKKMKFVLAKRVLKRKMQKEKVFQAELLAQIREAEKFSAEDYVMNKLARLKEVPPPKREIVRMS